jgi:hypothetical protein
MFLVICTEPQQCANTPPLSIEAGDGEDVMATANASNELSYNESTIEGSPHNLLSPGVICSTGFKTPSMPSHLEAADTSVRGDRK